MNKKKDRMSTEWAQKEEEKQPFMKWVVQNESFKNS